MTRNEAIAELVRIWHSPHLDLILKARLGEVIEALKGADGDLISRQDVVNEIHKYFVEEIDKTPTEIDEDGDELYADMPTVNSLLACNKELSKRIKSLPSAEPKTGEWIRKKVTVDDLTFTREECDQCGRLGSVTWNFCPNCGAEMTKGGDDE